MTEAPIHHSLLHGTGMDLYYFNDHVGLPIVIGAFILSLVGMFVEDYIRSRKEKHAKTA